MKRYPRFEFLLHTKYFAIKIGQFMDADAYGLAVAWGYDSESAGFYASTHRHSRRWFWWTAQELMNRG